MRMNYTRPGRLHLIWKDGLFYVTLWLFNRRIHWCNQKAGPSDHGWWTASA